MAGHGHGHSFRNIRVEPNARAHIGDNYQSGYESPLSRLPYANGASFKSSRNDLDQEAECLPGTRKKILEQIHEWVDGPSQACVFWLSGMAERGKSTVARTIARTYHNKKQLGASFFFSKGSSDVSQPAKFFTTIAVQLASSCPMLKTPIARAVEQNENVGNETFRDQWNQLILEPLSTLDPESSLTLSTLVLVVDALDECESQSAIPEILRVLSGARTLTAVRLRILVTSRPGVVIDRGFRAMPPGVFESLPLDNVPRRDVDEDISRFYNDRFQDIIRGFMDVSPDWPGKDKIAFLVQQASGLFIYAATVCRFIQQNSDWWHPTHLVAMFIPDQRSDSSRARTPQLPSASPTAELDTLYTTILGQSMAGIQTAEDQEKLAQYLKLALGTLVGLFQPLSTAALASLLNEDEQTLHTRLRRLRSVLHVSEDLKEPIQLLHPSFRDFLTSEKRCGDGRFQVDHATAHRLLTEHCLNRLTHRDLGLKKDICNLRHPGRLVKDIPACVVAHCIPLDLQYSCVHWTHHLKAARTLPQDHGSVHQFLAGYFVHWLEALSLIKRYADGIMSLFELETVVTHSQSPRTYEWVRDAQRFIRHGQSRIEAAPLQVYCSTLVFSPESSVVKNQFRDQIPSWIKRLPLVEQEWTSCLQVFQGHKSIVEAVAFSPDGRIVASGSRDSTVKLWDPTTGILSFTLTGHSNSVRAVAFSPSGQLLASASWDGTVKLWDPADGSLQATLPSNSALIHRDVTVCFSPDGSILASGFSNIITVWNLDTRKPYLSFDGYTNGSSCLAFSLNGKLLASASKNSTVLLRHCATGSIHKCLQHNSPIQNLSFSPVDDVALITVCLDGTVNVWDINRGFRRLNLNHPNTSVAFSPDGNLFASHGPPWNLDGNLYLCDLGSNTPLAVLRGHSFQITAATFSANGKLIASASMDLTIRLWDPMACIGVSNRVERDSRSHKISALAFSPYGHLLASGSLDGTIRLWDSTTRRWFAFLVGHLTAIVSLAFSPDGLLLASGSGDGAVIVWVLPKRTVTPDGQSILPTGEILLTLRCPFQFISGIAFSPDSRLVAASSNGAVTPDYDMAQLSSPNRTSHRFPPRRPLGTVLVWEVGTGRKLLDIMTSERLRSLRFDPETLGLPQTFQLQKQTGDPIPARPASLDVQQEWLTYEGQGFMYLPPDYSFNSLIYTTKGDQMVALDNASGRGVIFIEFDFEVEDSITPRSK